MLSANRSFMIVLLIAAVSIPWHVVQSAPAETGQPAAVTIDAAHTLASLPDIGIGVNTAVWDGNLQGPVTSSRLQQAGVTLLRYPGGSTADDYHWQTNSITPGQGGYANPNNTFDRYMTNTVQPTGAQALITVNYGSNAAGNAGGDPNEAAGWVDYANTKHYGIKYWEIGNELYGNGYYGANWETDLHTDHSPTAYANNSLAFAQAMKAKDPTIKIGLIATSPGDWPDGQGPQQWNPTVLSLACSAADFLVVHWYPQNPGNESDAGLLASTDGIATRVNGLRAQINQYCGSHASQVSIMVTETNSVSSNPGKQTTSPINGLFLLQDYSSWLRAGVQNVDWWDLRNGASYGNSSPSLAGTTTVGSYGILSAGESGEPPLNAFYASGIAMQMLAAMLPPGSTFVQASSSVSLLNTYAVRQPDGRLALLAVNDSPTNTYSVSPAINGYGAIQSATGTAYSLANPQLTGVSVPIQNGAISYDVGPYTALLFELSSALPTATPIANPTATPVPTTGPTPTIAPSATPNPTGTTGPGVNLLPYAVAAFILGNFENSTDGFTGNENVSNVGPSTWAPTVSMGSSSLWVQYNIAQPWAEAQVYRDVNADLRRFKTLNATVFPKSPVTAGAGVKMRFQVWGSDGQWYGSPYQTVSLNTRSAISWDISSIPRNGLKQVYVCFQYTTGDTGVGNEVWVDGVFASS